MFCKQCGFKLDGDSKFCGKCGHEIITEKYIPPTDNINQTKDKENKKQGLFALAVLSWILSLVFMISIYDANHNYPKGPSYPTGDVVCLNDDRGPCGPEYKEDTSNLNVSDWVKFFKSGDSNIILIGLVFIGIIAYYKFKEEK